MNNRRFFIIFVLSAIAWAIFCTVAMSMPRQTQPDAKRIREIQAALVDHNYAPGKTWKETQEILRSIARDRHWQTRWAPDARVLILLGLSDKDPQVLDEERNRLDGGTDEVES